MSRLIAFLKKHQRRIEIVLLVSTVIVVYALPHALRWWWLSNEGLAYQPLSLTVYFDEINVTGARLHEILDGRIRIADIDVVEYIDGPSFMPMLPPLILAPITLLTKSVNATIIIAQSALPGIGALILYWMAKVITDNKHRLALWFALMIALFPRIGLFITPTSINELKRLIVNLIPWQHKLFRDRLGFEHMESLVPNFLIFGPALILLLLAAARPQKKWFILLGIATGLMFYTYVFHWMFIVVAAGLMGICALYNKDWFTVKWLCIAGLIALALSSYYFYNYLLIEQLPQAELIKNAVWIEHSHAFRWGEMKHYLVLLTLSGIVFRIAKKANQKIGVAIIALLLSGIIVLNMQVITGFNIQPDHWPVRTNLLAIGIALLFILNHLLIAAHRTRTRTLRKIMIGGLAIAALFQVTGTLHSQYAYAKSNYNLYTIDPNFLDTLHTINNTIQTDDVILAARLSTHYFIPVYTKGKIYLPRAINSISPLHERFERLVIAARLFGWEDSEIYELFDPTNNNIEKPVETIADYDKRGLLYFFSGAALPRTLDGHKITNERYKLSDEYKHELDAAVSNIPSFSPDVIKKYQLDYILIDEVGAEKIRVDLDAYPFLKRTMETNGYVLYRVEQ